MVEKYEIAGIIRPSPARIHGVMTWPHALMQKRFLVRPLLSITIPRVIFHV
ncbi:MAG TPA: hypothetical protein PK024_00750 [Methanospirillum sp.]|nr:hypothetical protein [Methanospirillum sp.]